MFNTTFNNISVISRPKELGYPEKTTDLPQVIEKHLSHKIVWISSTPRDELHWNFYWFL
jgi:hypothetical protein